MINKYYNLLFLRIDNLYNISTGKTPQHRFFYSQVDQFHKIFNQLIEQLVLQNTKNRDIIAKWVKENQELKSEIKKLKAKNGIKPIKKAFKDKYFPFD